MGSPLLGLLSEIYLQNLGKRVILKILKQYKRMDTIEHRRRYTQNPKQTKP